VESGLHLLSSGLPQLTICERYIKQEILWDFGRIKNWQFKWRKFYKGDIAKWWGVDIFKATYGHVTKNVLKSQKFLIDNLLATFISSPSIRHSFEAKVLLLAPNVSLGLSFRSQP
jgi:hypothetical protein